jgi:hypothetical protein
MDIVECNVENTTFKMIVSNDWERNRVQTLATKEPETVRWILDTFQPGDTLLDVGANIGIYAVLAAAHRPDGTVIAVEPMAATLPASATTPCSTSCRTFIRTAWPCPTGTEWAS